MDRILTTVAAIVLALVASGGIFIVANKLLDVAPRQWGWFTTGLGAVGGFLTFLILWANRVVESLGIISLPVPDWTLLEVLGMDIPVIALIAGAIGGAAGYVFSLTADRAQRLGIGVGAGAALALLMGLFMRTDDAETADDVFPPVLPELDYGALVLWTLLGVAVGAVLGFGLWAGTKRRTQPVRTVLFWAGLGWLAGGWLMADLGADGTKVEAIIASLGVAAAFGAWIGMRRRPDLEAREAISRKSRVYVFLTPALGFIAATLVIPLLRTLWLSFFRGPPRRPGEFAWFGNYVDVFTDSNVINLDNWTNIFTSNLFFWGIGLVVIGLVAARLLGRRTGHALEASPGTMGTVAIGVFLLGFAVFTVLRGTIINNLWWVFTVTALATALGLAIAVLADRARHENLAKSLIFMPMAISFVGAAIIWRFMYIARPPQDTQTGAFNTIWVGLGKLSNSAGPRLVVVVVILMVVLFLAYLGLKAYRSGAGSTVAVGAALTILPLLWVVWRLLGPGLGGFIEGADRESVANTVIFLSESPFNNVWLMIVLIWVQTGFAMVIFSAAIKAVPADLLEAAKVDGATESQTFWRVTIPQIAPTIGVVVTTLIVVVLKVFDIVKVMTNGNFDTQVIANEMWQRAFTELNFGLGSALAIILFIFVLPIMYLNVKRMQEAQ